MVPKQEYFCRPLTRTRGDHHSSNTTTTCATTLTVYPCTILSRETTMYKGPLEPSYKQTFTPQNKGLENSLYTQAIKQYTNFYSIVDLLLSFLKSSKFSLSYFLTEL